MLKYVGPNLTQILKEKNVSQAEIARLSGLPVGRINSWVRGHKPRYQENVRKVEEVLGLREGFLENPPGADLSIFKHLEFADPSKKDSPELLDELLNEFDMKKLVGIKMRVNQTKPSSQGATKFKQDLLWVIDELHMRVSVND